MWCLQRGSGVSAGTHHDVAYICGMVRSSFIKPMRGLFVSASLPSAFKHLKSFTPPESAGSSEQCIGYLIKADPQEVLPAQPQEQRHQGPKRILLRTDKGARHEHGPVAA